MTTELLCLTLITLFAALVFLPFMLNILGVRGLTKLN